MTKQLNEFDARQKLGASLNPKSLPLLAADILKWSLGHTKVRILDGPGDGRRDILSYTPEGDEHLTQCKHHNNKSSSVSSRETDEIVIAMAKFGVNTASFFTNGRISPQAKREYLDNFPQYSMDYFDGSALLQFVEESPLLARMWLHGSTLGMITHRLKIPYIIRNADNDTQIDPSLSQHENDEPFFGSRELFEPYRPAINTENKININCRTITGERRLSLSELPIAIDEIKQNFLRQLEPMNRTLIIRFGKASLSNPKSNNAEDEIWLGGIEPESYVIDRDGKISSEQEWLLPDLGCDWQFPKNISVAEVEWSGWFSAERDTFIMYEFCWPYIYGRGHFYEIVENVEREAVSRSYFVATSDLSNKSILEKLAPHWSERLGDENVYGWLHPYLRWEETGERGHILTDCGRSIPSHPDEEKFNTHLNEVRRQVEAIGLKEFSSDRAIHLAAALEKPLVHVVSNLRAPGAELIEYFEDIPSPAYFLNRTFSYVQMWEVDETVEHSSEDFSSIQSQLPALLSLFIDIKRGSLTGKLFAMVSVSAKNKGSEKATQHARRLIDTVANMTPSLEELIKSVWNDAVLATKRFWCDEVGMFFEDGEFIGRPFIMCIPNEEAKEKDAKLFIIPPDELSSNEI